MRARRWCRRSHRHHRSRPAIGEHRAQRDQDADTGRRRAEPVGEGFQHLLQVLTRDDADRQRAEDQREERMQLDHSDQDDDHRDTGKESQYQLPTGRDSGFRVKVRAWWRRMVGWGWPPGGGADRAVTEVTAVLADTYRGHGSTSRVRVFSDPAPGRRRGGLHRRRRAQRCGDRERVFGAAASSTTIWRLVDAALCPVSGLPARTRSGPRVGRGWAPVPVSGCSWMSMPPSLSTILTTNRTRWKS